MKRRNFVKKEFLLLLLVAVVCFALFAILLIRWKSQQTWKDSHPLADPKVGFQFYLPTKLPPGFSIKNKVIFVHHSAPHALKDAAVEMSFRTEDNVYGIQEYRYTNEEVNTALRNFDPVSVGVTCTEDTSPKGQPFRLCHWIDYGYISVYEIAFEKDGVYLYSTLPATLQQTLAQGDLRSFVDSFKPADPSGISISADTI